MNVFLSYALGTFDAPIAARLRAVAAAYDVSILLPDREQVFHNGIPVETRMKLHASDAVIALITNSAPPDLVGIVNQELQQASELHKPVIALLEQGIQFKGESNTQIVYFNRFEPTAHENALMTALSNIRQQQQQWKQSLTALGWIAGITLGLVALSELVSDKK